MNINDIETLEKCVDVFKTSLNSILEILQAKIEREKGLYQMRRDILHDSLNIKEEKLC